MINNAVWFLRILLAVILMVTWELLVAVAVGIETGLRWYIKLWLDIIDALKENSHP